jgi:hypothetical protein
VEGICIEHLPEGTGKFTKLRIQNSQRVFETGTLDPPNKQKCGTLECIMLYSQVQNIGTSNKLKNYTGKNIS